MQRNTPLLCLLGTGLTLAAFTTSAEAAIVLSDPVAARTTDRVGGSGGDGTDIGNVLNNGQNDSWAVGDSTAASDEFRPVAMFDISSYLADISGAESIIFSAEVTRVLGDLGSFDLVALTANEDGSLEATDYSAPATFVQSFNSEAFSVDGDGNPTSPQFITADVTEFVKADAAALQDFTGFRLQASNPDTYNNADGNPDIVQFGTNGSNNITLTITPIPEPASAAIVGMGGLALLGRRRRS